jgi:hypothetical protein
MRNLIKWNLLSVLNIYGKMKMMKMRIFKKKIKIKQIKKKKIFLEKVN